MPDNTNHYKQPVPRKLDDGIIEALSQAVLKVYTFPDACALTNISLTTLMNWFNKAKEEEEHGFDESTSQYCKLVASLKRARAETKRDMIEVIKHTAQKKKEWLPAAWFLERTDPDNFGRRERHDINIEQKTLDIKRVEIVMPHGRQYEQLEQPQDIVEVDYIDTTN